MQWSKYIFCICYMQIYFFISNIFFKMTAYIKISYNTMIFLFHMVYSKCSPIIKYFLKNKIATKGISANRRSEDKFKTLSLKQHSHGGFSIDRHSLSNHIPVIHTSPNLPPSTKIKWTAPSTPPPRTIKTHKSYTKKNNYLER